MLEDVLTADLAGSASHVLHRGQALIVLGVKPEEQTLIDKYAVAKVLEEASAQLVAENVPQ